MCSYPNSNEANFCVSCGSKIIKNFCLNCQSELSNEYAYCPNCGIHQENHGSSTPVPVFKGKIVGNRYIIDRFIASGGWSSIYRANDMHLPVKTWALKVQDCRSNKKKLFLVRQEANLLNSLDHIGFPKCVDYFEESGYCYTVIDYIEGITLFNWITNSSDIYYSQKYDIDLIRFWMVQLCKLINYLHSRSPCIFGLDIKPSNIMLTSKGIIKLIDLGTACTSMTGKAISKGLGTPGYSAPEQLDNGRELDARSDVFSLGMTLFHMISKRNPNEFEDRKSIHESIKSDNKFPDDFKNIINKATQENPQNRFATISELLASLMQMDFNKYCFSIVETADEQYNAGEYSSAIPIYYSLINEIGYKNPQVYLNLARCYFNVNLPILALDILEQRLHVCEMDSLSWHELGVARFYSGDFRGAIEAYNSALATGISKGPSYREIGKCFAHLGDWESSVKFYLLAKENAYDCSGELEDALKGLELYKSFNSIVVRIDQEIKVDDQELYENFVSVVLQWGEFLISQGCLWKMTPISALAFFNQSIVVFGYINAILKDPRILRNLGIANWWIGEISEDIISIQKAIAFFEDCLSCAEPASDLLNDAKKSLETIRTKFKDALSINQDQS